MITTYEGEDRQPILSADEKSIYYLSEASGTFNVHKMQLDGLVEPQQLTNFKLHPVRFLSMGNGVLSFGYDGELYTMKGKFLLMEKKLHLSQEEKFL